jgi:hypothetical protein
MTVRFNGNRNTNNAARRPPATPPMLNNNEPRVAAARDSPSSTSITGIQLKKQ